MNAPRILAAIVAAGCIVVVGIALSGDRSPRRDAAEGGDATATVRGSSATERADATDAGGTDPETRVVGRPSGPSSATDARMPDRTGLRSGTFAGERSAGVRWPVDVRARTTTSGAASDGEPSVPVELAFRALNYVGVDPEAERTWRRAIDDPAMPAGVRSDLIEDLNDEGYTDNSRPTKDDLPLILARLELIERLAPHAMDEVNAAAFQEAYKDLLEMYVRLAGER